MEDTCSWCHKKAPFLHTVEVKVLTYSNDQLVTTPKAHPICSKCKEELKDYEISWEVVSH